MGMFGIIIMVIENELSSAGVYNKVSSSNLGNIEVIFNLCRKTKVEGRNSIFPF